MLANLKSGEIERYLRTEESVAAIARLLDQKDLRKLYHKIRCSMQEILN